MKKKTTVFTFGEGKDKPIKATISEYHTYFDSGILPFNQKRPSRKVKDLCKFLGMGWILDIKDKDRS
jgi:hypothetical protein